MLKYDFNKVALKLYWDRISAWVFSCKFHEYFKYTFSNEHLWRDASGHLSVILVFLSTACYVKNFRRSECFVSNKYFCFLCLFYLVIQNSGNGGEQTTDGKFPSDNVTHGINTRIICCIDKMFFWNGHILSIVFKETGYSL